MKKLMKSSTDRKVFGVLGGISEYFGFNSTAVRILFGLLCIYEISFIGIYLIAALIMENPKYYY